MLQQIRRFAKPKTVLTILGTAAAMTAFSCGLDHLFAGAAVPTELLKEFLRHFLEDLNVHRTAVAVSYEMQELDQHTETIGDAMDAAVGRALAGAFKTLQEDSQDGRLSLSAFARHAKSLLEGNQSLWISAASTVKAEFQPDLLRDFCLTNGALPEGQSFLTMEQWIAFLKALTAGASVQLHPDTADDLWRSLAVHFEREFPRQFVNEVRNALAGEQHSALWISVQLQIHSHIVYLARTHTKALDDHRQLLDQLLVKFGEHTKLLEEQRAIGAQSLLRQISATLPPHYVSRLSQLEELHAAFTALRQTGVRGGAAIVGGEGDGKTILALAYAFEVLAGRFTTNLFPGGIYLITLDAKSPKVAAGMLRRQMAGLVQNAPAGSEGIKERAGIAQSTLSKLQASLLIIDGLSGEEVWSNEEVQKLLPGSNCQILVTTTAQAIHGLKSVHVSPLEEAETLKILARYRADASEDKNRQCIVSLHQQLGGWPIAVAVVGAFMSLEEKVSWSEANSWISNLPTTDFPDRNPAVNRRTFYEKKVNLILDAVRDRLPTAERLTLDVSALLPHGLIPETWLRRILELRSTKKGQKTKLLLGNRPSGLPQTPDGVIEHMIDLGLLTIARQEPCSITKAAAGGKQSRLFTLHRFHEKRSLEKMTAGNQRTLEKEIISVAKHRGEWLSNGADFHQENWVELKHRWEIEPLIALGAAFLDRKMSSIDLAELFNCLGFLLLRLGHFEDALKYFTSALEMVRKIHGTSDHTDVAQALNNYGKCLKRLGRKEQALPVLEDALAMRERLFGSRDS